MEFHESALDVIYEDHLSCSDVEEGEIEDGEFLGFQPMDVDPGEARAGSEEGEVFEDAPSPVAVVDNAIGNGDHEVFEFKSEIVHQNSGASKLGELAGRRHKRKRPSKKRSGKRQNVDVARFVRETCIHLHEKKLSLIWALVKKLGVDAVRDLVHEVNVIEKCGGQLTNDRKRRRTPGGVLWNILKGRVQPDVYKEIMSQGNEVQKQKVKEVKETLKRQRMDIDERTSNNKRQKLASENADIPMGGTADGKQVSHQRLKGPKKSSILTDGPVRDDSLLPTVQLQKAWAEGIRKRDDRDTGTVTTSGVGTELGAFKASADSKSSTEQKPAPVIDRLRVPVEYSDLVTDDEGTRSDRPDQGGSLR